MDPSVINKVRHNTGFCQRDTGSACCCDMKLTVYLHVGFHGKEVSQKLVHELLWLNRHTVSLSQRLSYFIGWEVKDWNWFNYIEVLFKVHCLYDLMLTVISVTVFVLALHYYCRFPAHTNNTFALLWKWTCWRCYTACIIWNCRLEVPSTLANISLLCLS